MKLRTSRFRWQSDSEGTWLCVLSQDAQKALEAVETGTEYTVEIKRYKKPRSLDANAYAWVLIDKISSAVNVSKVDVYRQCIRNIGGVSETVCVRDKAVDKLAECWERNGLGWQAESFKSKIPGCTNVTLYYGSSSYDSAQMSRLIDQLVDEAKALGIETMPPDKLAAILGEWK